MFTYLEKLSKLELSKKEREKLTFDLTKMLQMIEQLKEVDTEGVEPLVYMNQSHSLTRDDVVQGELSVDEALKNAPLANDSYFKVPKVIDL